jgi:PRC-barrel domain
MSAAAVRKQTPVGDARSAAPKGHTGYAVYDPGGQKIGTAERVMVNPDGEPAYIRVRTGYFGTRVVLIPVQFVETDETRKKHRLEGGASCIPIKLEGTPSQDITWEEGLLPEEASTHVTSVYPNWKERRLWRHYRY